MSVKIILLNSFGRFTPNMPQLTANNWPKSCSNNRPKKHPKKSPKDRIKNKSKIRPKNCSNNCPKDSEVLHGPHNFGTQQLRWSLKAEELQVPKSQSGNMKSLPLKQTNKGRRKQNGQLFRVLEALLTKQRGSAHKNIVNTTSISVV